MLKVTCAIIIQNNKMLITQNGPNSDHPFTWEFPGGKIDQGESAEECIIREITEELNIEVRILQLLQPIIYDYGIKEIELIPFICQLVSGKIELREHVDSKWIDFVTLKKVDLSDADKKLINEKINQSILKKYIGE